MLCKNGHETESKPCKTCKKEAAARFKAKKAGEKIDLPSRPLPNDNKSGVCWWCDRPLHMDPHGSAHCPVHVETNSSFCVPEKMNDGSRAALFFAVGKKKYDDDKRGPLK